MKLAWLAWSEVGGYPVSERLSPDGIVIVGAVVVCSASAAGIASLKYSTKNAWHTSIYTLTYMHL